MEELYQNGEKVLYDDLKYLINLSSQISSFTKKKECDEIVEYASNFYAKNSMAACTVLNILDEKLTCNEKTYIDIPTAYTVLRSIFEGYVNFNYIFEVENIEKIKLNIWLCKKNAEHEKIKMQESLGAGNDDFVEAAFQKIENYKNKIKSLDYFNDKISKSEQESILNTQDWKYKPLGAVKRAKISSIHESNAELIFKYTSNFSHAEPFALEVINSLSSGDDDFKEHINRILIITISLLSKTLELYSKINPMIKEMFVNNDQFNLILRSYWELLEKKLNESN